MKPPWGRPYLIHLIPAVLFCSALPSCQSIAENIENRSEPLPQKVPYMVRIESREGLFRGTGFVVSNNGLVLTVSHVVRYDNPVRVIFNGKLYLAETVFDDPITDFTLVRLPLNRQPLDIGIPCFWVSDSIRSGDTVIVLGERQQGGVVPIPAFMISWTSFHIWPGSYQEVMRIYPVDSRHKPKPGFSGGPIFNIKKYIIGLFCCIENASRHYYNGIPSSLIVSKLYGTEFENEICTVSETRPFPLPGFIYNLREVSYPPTYRETPRTDL
jgi:S1-C subfamily serine protease